MKASVTFREERSPLIRMKFPLTVASFPLVSGIAFGDNQDVALHLGTVPDACPSVKITYQPNMPSSPVSLVLKTGIGPWGPPCKAALSLSAEVKFSRSFSGPFLAVHIKPRLGDFSLRKAAKLSCFSTHADTPKSFKASCGCIQTHSQSFKQSQSSAQLFSEAPHQSETIDDNNQFSTLDDGEAVKRSILNSSHGLFDDATVVTPLQLNKSSLFTPVQDFSRTHNRLLEESESLDHWRNGYARVEDFGDGNTKLHEHGTRFSSGNQNSIIPNLNNSGGHQSCAGSPHSTSAISASAQRASSVIKAVEAFSIPWHFGTDDGVKGWSLHAHTSLPLGSQTAIKLRWGVNAHHTFQGWDTYSSNFKVPYLFLQKVSLMSTNSVMNSQKVDGLSNAYQLPMASPYEEIHELYPVTALCGSMKHQLQLLYAENQVLKKAMEEMKAQFDQQMSEKSRKFANNVADMTTEISGTHVTERKVSSKETDQTSGKSSVSNAHQCQTKSGGIMSMMDWMHLKS
ncbi:hypothetical protein KP509_03G058300 [Ceratopteris richardii]|uniref:Uncharacterized protein n=1 Tax=Ceratopteris richardii TaxID=49495 RepID=A0A8T2VBT8_CERRI|nr:hypothetical protein KP509_03G058300 [Ceratopteris richardii]